jgi:hypothetical protein
MPSTAESDRTTGVVGNNPGFGCGRIVNWKTDSPKRIFREWRQLSDAIAAPSTNALMQSS